MIASNRLDDATMDVELRRNKDEIFSDAAVFDRREKSVRSIEANLSICSKVAIALHCSNPGSESMCPHGVRAYS